VKTTEVTDNYNRQPRRRTQLCCCCTSTSTGSSQ